jgi:hypothetical protein
MSSKAARNWLPGQIPKNAARQHLERKEQDSDLGGDSSPPSNQWRPRPDPQSPCHKLRIWVDHELWLVGSASSDSNLWEAHFQHSKERTQYQTIPASPFLATSNLNYIAIGYFLKDFSLYDVSFFLPFIMYCRSQFYDQELRLWNQKEDKDSTSYGKTVKQVRILGLKWSQEPEEQQSCPLRCLIWTLVFDMPLMVINQAFQGQETVFPKLPF